MYLDIRIHQVFVFSYEGFLDIGHDAGVHPGESLGSVDLQVVASPLSLCRYALWYQEIAEIKIVYDEYNVLQNFLHKVWRLREKRVMVWQ